MKINVIGTSGSGKSSFSKRLAAALSIKHIEMDTLFWGRNWSMATDEELFNKLEKAMLEEKWVLDGNYNHTASLKWAHADTLIWLDFSYARTLYQIISRSLARAITRKEIWPETGNKESFRKLFFSKDSMLLWVLKTYKKNKISFSALFSDPRYSNIHIVRLRSPKEAQSYLDNLRES